MTIRERPLASLHASQRDLLILVAHQPRSDGLELREAMDDATGGDWARQSIHIQLNELAERGLVEWRKDGNSKRHTVTPKGRQLLEDDLRWQRELLQD